jgi:hypothetical protein
LIVKMQLAQKQAFKAAQSPSVPAAYTHCSNPLRDVMCLLQLPNCCCCCWLSGHLQQLRTLVDVSITRQLAAPQQQQQQQQQLLYAGGGAPGLQLQLSVQQLVEATAAAETRTFNGVAFSAAPAVQQPGDGGLQSLQQQQQQWAAQLPVPWPAGSSDVQLIGVVAQRRR